MVVDLTDQTAPPRQHEPVAPICFDCLYSVQRFNKHAVLAIATHLRFLGPRAKGPGDHKRHDQGKRQRHHWHQRNGAADPEDNHDKEQREGQIGHHEKRCRRHDATDLLETLKLRGHGADARWTGIETDGLSARKEILGHLGINFRSFPLNQQGARCA